MSQLHLADADSPQDTPPPTSGDYNPEYPGSTAEAPYGYKPDGTPYKRRPKGTGGASGSGTVKSPASDAQAKSAAYLLSRANVIVGISLAAFGMPMTTAALADANEDFEKMAYEALLTDPALCRKILSAGATSGKAGLVMAYASLGVSIMPAARDELRAKRLAKEAERESYYDGNADG